MKKTILLALILSAGVAGCGIKPGSLKAPEGSKDVYPRAYPTPDKDKGTKWESHAKAKPAPAPITPENDGFHSSDVTGGSMTTSDDAPKTYPAPDAADQK